MSGVLAGIRRVNRTTRPEESVLLRVTVLAAVLTGVVAAWAAGAAPAFDAVLALLLLPAGAWVSYRRRAADNTLIKLALTLGAALALYRFFAEIGVAASIDDTRAPLASLFLGVQILHGFDLPQRRDLGFTLASSLTLVALGATSTHAGIFGVLLVMYLALAAVSLAAVQRSAARQHADALRDEHDLVAMQGGDPEAAGWAPGTRHQSAGAAAGVLGPLARSGAGLVRAAGPVLLAGLLVFMLLPRAQSGAIGTLPFRGFPGGSLASPFVSNPGLAGGGQSTGASRSPVPFNPTAYFGLSEYVDLRTVGQLADDPVLRVRAAQPRLWRGMVFTTYDGVGWTRQADQPPPATFGLPVNLAPQYGAADLGAPPPRSTMTQTFELLTETPNLVFGAAEVRQLYIAGGSAYRWDDGTISTGATMDEGTVYSVVSAVTTAEPQQLRAATGPTPDEVRDTYLQLPQQLPSRVRALAARLTDGSQTNYAKAEAVEAWLGENVEYTLDAPAPPRDGDTVDHFLFDSQRGWCEPIASSMVVLLRAAGVPARFTTGFQPGDRNPISGVYDVVMSDAHAWVEVWVPRHGWVTFDPTGAVPLATGPSTQSSVPLLELFRWVADTGRRLVPAGLGDVARSLGAPAGAVGIAAVAGLGLATVWRRRRNGLEEDPGPLAGVAALVGVPRDPWQTPREYVARVRLRRPDLPRAPLDVVLADEEHRRYADPDAAGSREPAPAVADALASLRAHERSRDQRHP